MKHVVWKVFANYEKEEKWLNEMSAKGMAMTCYTWCRYVFTESENNEYTYRMELLKNSPAHAESAAYIKFLEESGIECVDSYMRWLYLRKKSDEGKFDIYSDLESKIMHYKRVQSLWLTMMWLEFICGFANIFLGAVNLTSINMSNNFPYVNLFLGLLLIVIGLFFMVLKRQVKVKIGTLQKEKEVRE